MTRARFRSRAGFTLLELLVGATLSAAVMAAVLSSYLFMGRHLARLANQQILQSESRRTLAYFNQDVRMASGLSGTISATAVTFTLPAGTTTNSITYYYNSTSADVVVSVSGTNVTMVANTLTRAVYNGTTVTAQTLLRNITAGGLTFRYYDTTAREYITATLTAGSYLAGIKQLSLEFSTQTGNSASGTQTPIYSVASNRLIIRNRALLP